MIDDLSARLIALRDHLAEKIINRVAAGVRLNVPYGEMRASIIELLEGLITALRQDPRSQGRELSQRRTEMDSTSSKNEELKARLQHVLNLGAVAQATWDGERKSLLKIIEGHVEQMKDLRKRLDGYEIAADE